MEQVENYINGKKTPPDQGQYLDNIAPAEGKVFSRIPDSDKEDVNRAVTAAHAAFKSWSTTPAEERSALMLRVAAFIERDLETLSRIESIDTGKPISLARSLDIPRAAANFRFFATAAPHFSSDAHQTDSRALNYTLRHPVGVAACISPWNLPLYLFTWKIAPALAAGCTVVGKPSELTPMSADYLSRLFTEAEFPPGVFNVVHGRGTVAGQSLVAHPDVAAISFTGGTKTGKQISTSVAPLFRKLSLEMGGKNPNIIFADADWETAMETTIRSSFSNQGEICLCGSRILVERKVYDRFVEDFVDRTRALSIGDPMRDNVDIGALISEAHRTKVLSYVELARSEGGTVETGGECVSVPGRCSSGFFFQPTVITGLSTTCRTNQEEIFGPVVTILPFSDESEAVSIANNTPYGLSATIWTENLGRAHRVASHLQCGIVWVNCWMLRDLRTPFGGVKQSGVGREGGWNALEFFTETKNVCIRL